jgi:exodeoxyribonuclease VII small subunit
MPDLAAVSRRLVTINGMPEEQPSPLSFEKSLEELERTVKELEKGDLSLERSLMLFESGMRLSAECKKLLEEAESRVEVLSKRGGEMVAAPYSPEKSAK